MTAKEVAAAADTFFDRSGKPLEKSVAPISHVAAANCSSATSQPTPAPSASPFTPLFNDEGETDVNQVRRNNFQNNGRRRSQSRGPRGQSRPPFNRASNPSSNNNNSGDNKPTFPPGTCRWHRLFGDKSRKCVTDCPKYKAFTASQQSGNGQGGRRL